MAVSYRGVPRIPAGDALHPMFKRGPLWSGNPNRYSQNGEDCVIEHVFKVIGTTSRHAFEFGSADGIWLSNTRVLWEQGWTVHLVDSRPQEIAKIESRSEERVRFACAQITPGNVDEILTLRVGCPIRPDLGVIDIDGQDIHVWEAMQVVRPRLVCIEVDPSDKAEVPKVGGTGQAPYSPMIHMGRKKGYVPVWRNAINVFFVDSEVLNEPGSR